MSSFSITTFATTFGAIFSIPFFLVDLNLYNYNFNLDFKAIYAVIYLGIFPTAIAFQFRYYMNYISVH